MSKLRSAKSKNIHELVSFLLSTAILSACSVGLDESSRVGGSGFDQFGRESSADNVFSDQEITGGPAGPGGAFRSSAGTSGDTQAESSSSDDPSSDAASKSGDGAGTGDGTDAAQDAVAADVTAADATASPSPSPSADASAASSEVPTCPNDDSNAIVKIHVRKVGAGVLSVLADIGYQTCAGSTVTWLLTGSRGTAAEIELARGVISLIEARAAVGSESYIVGFDQFRDKDNLVYSESSPLPNPSSGITSVDSHSCEVPASSIVLRDKNSDGSIRRFCLVANGLECDCTVVPATSSTSVVAPSPSPLAAPTVSPSVKVPAMKLK